MCCLDARSRAGSQNGLFALFSFPAKNRDTEFRGLAYASHDMVLFIQQTKDGIVITLDLLRCTTRK